MQSRMWPSCVLHEVECISAGLEAAGGKYRETVEHGVLKSYSVVSNSVVSE